MKKYLTVIILLSVIILGYLLYKFVQPPQVGSPTQQGSSNSDYNLASEDTTQKPDSTSNEPNIQVVLDNLEIPWEVAFLPENELLITQRTGSVLHVTANESNTIPVSGVEHIGEGGLLGLALHPNFTENSFVYLYLTSQTESGIINRVERYTFNAETHSLANREVILNNIPGARYHDGGRIAFGPDNLLYITTGDASESDLAQDANSLAGKILRITDTGTIPEGNPFNNEVFSYGHRNPQGIDWDENSRLWSSEHGPSVLTSGYDEINLIIPGGNYGWPEIQGNESKEGMISPVIQSGSEVTWAPADLAIHNNVVYFSGLRGEGLYSAVIEDSKLINLKKHFNSEYGRIRAVAIDPSGNWLYFSTSNTDGRGEKNESDDKVVKVNLEMLETLSVTK